MRCRLLCIKWFNAIATIKPPTTGSGILNVVKREYVLLENNQVTIQNLLKQEFDRYQNNIHEISSYLVWFREFLMSCVWVQLPQYQHCYVIHVVIESLFCRVPLGIFADLPVYVIFVCPEWNSRLACSEI